MIIASKHRRGETTISASILITVNGEKRTVEAGTRLSELFLTELPCGAHGKCGKCKVRASGELSPLTSAEQKLLDAKEISDGIRLACCTDILGECTVETAFEKSKDDAVLTAGRAKNITLNASFKQIGAAIDIGTTTLAIRLLSPLGEILAEGGMANPQASFGADVISRMESHLAGNGAELADTIRSAIDRMLADLCKGIGRDPSEIDGLVITGNTVMLYLLTNTTPEPLSHAPFTLTRDFGEAMSAKTLGLSSAAPDAEVYLAPCISAFVGGDTICAILCGELVGKENAMLVDIGTNGEMALYCKNSLYTCSTAAGPAFEGVGISMGMRGAPGAIDKVYLTENGISAHVIGETKPVGICGSGIVDAMAALLENGTVDETGFIEEDEVMILPPVALTGQDIRMIQLAKSAIYSGLKTLMHAANIDESEVTTLMIAGGFGSYLNTVSAGRIGLLPKSLVSKVAVIGNAALGGAELLLLNTAMRKDAYALAKSAQSIDLASDPYFADTYIEAMMFEE